MHWTTNSMKALRNVSSEEIRTLAATAVKRVTKPRNVRNLVMLLTFNAASAKKWDISPKTVPMLPR